MSGIVLEANLNRVDTSTPWGFRMQGGKDFGSPLMVSKVTPGSLAAKCGLQVGDFITCISTRETGPLLHQEAQSEIKRHPTSLKLTLQRGGAVRGFSDPASVRSATVTSNATAQFNSPNMDKLTSATNNMSLNNSPGRDAPREPGTEHQSRSFQLLKGAMDQGQEPSAIDNPPWTRPSGDQQVDENPKSWKASDTYRLVHGKDTSQAPALAKYDPLERELNSSRSPEFPPPPPPSETFPHPPPPQETLPPPPPVDPMAPRHVLPTNSFNLQPYSQGSPGKPTSSPGRPTNSPGRPINNYTPPAPVPAPQRSPGMWNAPRQTPQQPGGMRPGGVRPGPVDAPPLRPTGQGGVRVRPGQAVIKQQTTPRIPVCAKCQQPIRGPFVVAINETWCPEHFVCANPQCRVQLADCGFVEENGELYCEKDYAEMFADHCAKCDKPIVGEVVRALDKVWHTTCFVCNHCGQPIGAGTFHLEEGLPYCEKDWQANYQTMCVGCDFPIEPGDKFVDALGKNFHTECFNCATCQVNLEGQGFFARNGKPFCKKHAN